MVAGIPAHAHAQSGLAANIDAVMSPALMLAVAGLAIAVAAVLYAFRVAGASKHQAVHWSEKLAQMEAQLEKSDSILSAHPGLVLVWEDDNVSAEDGWGEPKILGGPAALASLVSFSGKEMALDASPVQRLLEGLADQIVNDENYKDPQSLKQKIQELRSHGMAFSGSTITSDGRTIEVDGRVAGGQVALWLTDPAVRLVEDGAVVGAIRERATDLHGSHALLDRIDTPAWRRNADLELVWVNPAFSQAVEAASVHDVLRQQIELDPKAKAIAAAAAKDKKKSEGVITINSGGERRVFRIVEMPMHGSGDAAGGGVAYDITALDRASDSLQRHIDANARTLDQISTAVSIFGANKELLYHNSAFQELWDLDDATLAGRAFHSEILDQLRNSGKLPEPADFNAWKDQQLSLYTEDLPAGQSIRDGDAPDEVWHLPDGRSLLISKQRHPFGGIMVVYEDITEKISLEAKFNTQINVQKATLNNLSEGVAVFGSDGGLRLFNKAFQKLWRLDRKDLDGNPHLEQVIEQISKLATTSDDVIDLIRRAVTSKSPGDRASVDATQLTLNDGRIFTFGLEPLPDGAMLAHFLDITDSVARESELKERNAILENADRLKSKFVDHVSYQLRTPLSTIIGFSEMIDGQMFGVLNDRQKDYIASILSASYHLRDLINDIIDLAVIDAGKMEISTQPTDIRSLLESAATFAALKAEDTKVSLKIDCPKEIGEAELDERRIKQVLFNLLSNAFAFTTAGDTITLGAERRENTIAFFVRDTGRGLSEDDQAKIFDAFESRGPNAGAGLGLALVKRFIDLHGGWVKFDAGDGEGVNVMFNIPQEAGALSIENRRRLEAPEAPKKQASKKKATGNNRPKKRKTATG